MSAPQHTKTSRSVTTGLMLFMGLMAGLMLGACAKQEQPGTQTLAPVSGGPIPAFSAQQLAAQPTDNWFTSGGSLYNQRYSPLDQINKTNIKQVKAEWQALANALPAGSTLIVLPDKPGAARTALERVSRSLAAHGSRVTTVLSPCWCWRRAICCSASATSGRCTRPR